MILHYDAGANGRLSIGGVLGIGCRFLAWEGLSARLGLSGRGVRGVAQGRGIGHRAPGSASGWAGARSLAASRGEESRERREEGGMAAGGRGLQGAAAGARPAGAAAPEVVGGGGEGATASRGGAGGWEQKPNFPLIPYWNSKP